MRQYETLLSFSSPFFEAAEVEWGQADSSEGSYLRLLLTQGAPVEAILSLTAELRHSHQRRHMHTHICSVCNDFFPYYHLHSFLIQCSVITRGTKKVKTQADFGRKLLGIRGLRALSWEQLEEDWGERRQRWEDV